MPINNKGKLTLSEVVRRQVDKDWPAANTDYDLFVQDLIAAGNVIANGLIIRNIEVSDNILTGNVAAGGITANTLVLDRITANTFVGVANSVFPATTQLVVTTPVFNYNLDQYSGDNPQIYVTAGETISFDLRHSSSHPFNIRVSNGGSAYNTGLTHVAIDGTISTGASAQGKYTGKLFWKIPYELAGNTYVYQCTNHASMVGNIVIQGSILDTINNKNVTFNNLSVSGDLTVQGNTVTLNTATLTVEDKNIVLANGAPNAATANGAGITIEGANASILYLDSGDKFKINKTVDILGDLIVTGNITGNGLIIRGIEVSDTVLSGNISAQGTLSGNTLTVDSITANIWNRLYTANVIETAGNLYFTVQRARNSFTAGQNITIVNGEISAEAQFLTVVNDSTTITATQGNLTYGMGRSIADSRNILVIVEGLIQIPQTDYTVDGTNLNFTDQPPAGANIEVRFFGAEGSSGSRPTLISTVNSFIGTGNVDYALSQSPAGKSYVTVVIDGVTQQNQAYNLTGTVLTFTEAPAIGANIDVRIISGQVGAPFNTRTFTGDGANTIFAISTNFNQDQILVFENGIAQVPGTDYTVSAGNVIFSIAPAANVGIQIRELASSGANLLTTIAGLNQTTGSLVPDVDGVRSLGSSTKRFKDLYLTGNTIVLGDIALSSANGLLQVSPVVNGNVVTANAAPSSFTAGDNISIAANGRVSSTITAGDNISIAANGRISSTITAGDNISIAANGRISASFAGVPGGFSFRNRLINGDMSIDQRNGGASQTITAAAALAYTVDRWYAYCTGANVTGQQVAGSNDTQYRYRFTGAAGVTKIGFAQRIESFNSYDLNNSTATLSVDLANSVLNTVTWTAYYANTANSFGTIASPTKTQIATGTFTVNSTVTRYSTQISIPSAATTGIEIEFSVAAQTGGTWTIGNVQLEKGATATPYEFISTGVEQLLCQRYFYRMNNGINSFMRFALGDVRLSTEINGIFILPTPMRGTVTISISSASHFAVSEANTNRTVTGITISSNPANSNWLFYSATVASGLTPGRCAQLISNNTTSSIIDFSAEL